MNLSRTRIASKRRYTKLAS